MITKVPLSKIILTLLVVLCFSLTSAGQCETDNFCDECIKKLVDAKFNFLKSYRVNGESGSLQQTEYPYVLTKGSKYMVNICANAQRPDKIQFTLSDYNRTRVATNIVGGRFLSDLIFECTSTGIYYFQYNFGEASVSCAGISIGFVRGEISRENSLSSKN